jgi:Tol biopolymer transport system component
MTLVTSGGSDVWIYDFTRTTFTRLTFGGSHRTPVWSLDGSYVYYVALAPDGSWNNIMRKPADGGRDEELVVSTKMAMFLRAVSADGRLLLIDRNTNANKTDIVTLAAHKDAQPAPLIATPFDEYAETWSPDGRWVAYQSDETSHAEIYVRESSGQGGRWQISTQGGEEPRWSADGRELYYRADTQMMVVPIAAGPGFRYDAPRPLFDGLYNLRVESGISYAVDPKRGRFLTIRLAEDVAPATAVRMMLDWTAELARLVERVR